MVYCLTKKRDNVLRRSCRDNGTGVEQNSGAGYTGQWQDSRLVTDESSAVNFVTVSTCTARK